MIYGNWEVIGPPLGSGGQGTVYKGRDVRRFDRNAELDKVTRTVSQLSSIATAEDRRKSAEQLLQSLDSLRSMDTPENLGAVKVLHRGNDPSEYKKAVERMNNEIRAYQSVAHPSVLKLLDHDVNSGLIVTEFQADGTLADHHEVYRGDVVACLRAVRPLIEAVSEMHKLGLVHRDIKPHNIFLKSDGRLLLGDAGLVFFLDEAHSRVTNTFENVGSRDWMPGWAHGMRIEEVKPNFDVFSLGKLIWAMISGKRLLRLWYLHEPEFELETMFPKGIEIYWMRRILDRCIVQWPKDCLPDASALLDEIDPVLAALEIHSQVVDEHIKRRCTVCGLGTYEYILGENEGNGRGFGLNTEGTSRTHKIFSCTYCGHAQLFFIPNQTQRPLAWQASKSS